MRMIALCASLFLLASCATPSAPPPPPAEPVPPPACDPQLVTPLPVLEPYPAGASIVSPATMEERVATALHLNWVASLKDVAQRALDRAGIAKSACDAGQLQTRVPGNPPP